MLAFDRVDAIPLTRSPPRVLIRWFVKPHKEDLRDYEFYIDSGGAEDSFPGKQDLDLYGNPTTPTPDSNAKNIYRINQTPIDGTDFYEYVDHTTLLKNLHAQIFYRIRCRKKSTQEEVVSDTFTWKGNLDLIAAYIVEEHDFLFKDVIGQPVLIYQRRRSGVQCDCFNPVLKQRTTSQCHRCYGTNWVGGFYKPVSTYASVQNPLKITAIEEFGETTPGRTQMFFTNYPILKTGDLIREVVENRLWRIVDVKDIEKRVTTMLQMATLAEVNAGDVEYSMPQDEALVRKLMDEFEGIKRRREF